LEILDSLEVRWFLSDADSALAAARAWFASTSPEGRRVDAYLRTGRDDLGFKARQVEDQPTKVETKYLLGELGPVPIGLGAIGKLERWRKISLMLDDSMLKKDGSWRTVEKERRLRKFAFQGGIASEVTTAARPDAGCGIELTQLRWQDESRAVAPAIAWTLGLEAFGPELMLLEIFQTTCRAALEAGLKLELGSELSMSYPQWLLSSGRRVK
jgi:hypothetical protein